VHSSQEVCPWNQKFSQALADGSPFGARELFREADAEALATHILQLAPEAYARAFRGSAMKRAKLRGLKRNAAVVLGNVGTHAAEEPLTRAVHDDDDMVREHAAWALGQLGRKIR
jgi:epoxyqueuosine reductase